MKNPNIRITQSEILSNHWYILKKVTFDYTTPDGKSVSQVREVYDRGNGAVILLYDKANRRIILTRQLRIPTFLNGNDSGMMIEACAGMLDQDDPEACIRRETQEETGYQIANVKKIFQLYMSPGAVTETIHFFTAEYTAEMKTSEGGGLASEQENIEVLEVGFDDALAMAESGSICDAKTIILLQYAQIHDLFNADA